MKSNTKLASKTVANRLKSITRVGGEQEFREEMNLRRFFCHVTHVQFCLYAEHNRAINWAVFPTLDRERKRNENQSGLLDAGAYARLTRGRRQNYRE